MMENSQFLIPEQYIINSDEIKKFYPKRKRNTHKGTYGCANIIAGSEKCIGAAALAVETALMSGCGYVRLTTIEKVKLALAAKYPQVIFPDSPDFDAQAIAVGMGCGVSEELYGLLKRLLSEYSGTLIIDADGLNALSKYGLSPLKEKNSSCQVILTPHVKEFSRLTGLEVNTILNNPIYLAQCFAKEYGVTLLLKGADSIITNGFRTAVNTRGTTALAKGGSGDMLSGLICGSAARGLKPFDAALCSAYTMGLSAEISSAEKTDYCATARDIIKNLYKAVKLLTN